MIDVRFGFHVVCCQLFVTADYSRRIHHAVLDGLLAGWVLRDRPSSTFLCDMAMIALPCAAPGISMDQDQSTAAGGSQSMRPGGLVGRDTSERMAHLAHQGVLVEMCYGDCCASALLGVLLKVDGDFGQARQTGGKQIPAAVSSIYPETAPLPGLVSRRRTASNPTPVERTDNNRRHSCCARRRWTRPSPWLHATRRRPMTGPLLFSSHLAPRSNHFATINPPGASPLESTLFRINLYTALFLQSFSATSYIGRFRRTFHALVPVHIHD